MTKEQLYNLLQRPPAKINPGSKEECAANRHNDTRKDLQFHEAPVFDVGNECTTNGVTRQCGEGNDRKESAVTDTHLTDVRNLGDESRGQRYESTGAETVKRGEDNGGSVRS